jgi:hypothetical protein
MADDLGRLVGRFLAEEAMRQPDGPPPQAAPMKKK